MWSHFRGFALYYYRHYLLSIYLFILIYKKKVMNCLPYSCLYCIAVHWKYYFRKIGFDSKHTFISFFLSFFLFLSVSSHKLSILLPVSTVWSADTTVHVYTKPSRDRTGNELLSQQQHFYLLSFLVFVSSWTFSFGDNSLLAPFLLQPWLLSSSCGLEYPFRWFLLDTFSVFANGLVPLRSFYTYFWTWVLLVIHVHL